MLLMASLLTANLVCADTYKNNVVDVKVNKESGNSVKVTIYTDKPYTEPVVVNKKANNKYVILMPETKSVLKSAPTVTNGAGTVSNVSVNTQAVSGGKGYTKIIITSEKAINVVPRTQQMTGAKVVDKPSTTVTKLNPNKPVTTTAKPTTQAAKPTTQKPAATTKTAQKPKQEVKKTVQQKPITKPVVKTQPPVKVAVQPTKPVVNTKTVPTAQKPSQQPIDILENEIKTGKNSEHTINNEPDSVLENEIKGNILKKQEEQQQLKKKKKKRQVIYETEKGSVLESIKAVLKDFEQIGLWKLLLLAGAITFPVIVIMLILAMDKRINKKIALSFKREDDEQIDYQQPVAPQPQFTQNNTAGQETFNSFDEMLNKVDEPIPSFHEEQLHKAEYERFEQSVRENQEFNNDFEDSDFENNINSELESVVEDVQQVNQTYVVEPEPIQEPEIIEENAQEKTYVEPVDMIQTPEIIEEKEEIEQKPADVVQEPENQLEPYNPDGYLSDFSQVQDGDFFDELVIQTMADNNKSGLPDESPADEIFNYMSDEPENIAADLKQNSTPDYKPQYENTEQEKIVEPVAQVTNPIQETPVNEVKEPEQEETEESELTMLTEAKINDNSGLYLVNYENFSSLVGHIKDDYFVIKKFDDVVNSRIILKETEKLKDATRYLVRVGKNKMVVEVSETSMSRLLDL